METEPPLHPSTSAQVRILKSQKKNLRGVGGPAGDAEGAAQDDPQRGGPAEDLCEGVDDGDDQGGEGVELDTVILVYLGRGKGIERKSGGIIVRGGPWGTNKADSAGVSATFDHGLQCANTDRTTIQKGREKKRKENS
jgi:hypothetical protein